MSRVGDRAPDFRAPTSKGHTLGSDAFTEKLAVVLFFVGSIDEPAHGATVWAFDGLLPEFGARRVQLLGVARDTPRRVRDRWGSSALTVLADADGSIREAFGPHLAPPFSVVIDRTGRIADIVGGPTADHPPAVLGAVDRLLEDHPDRMANTASVPPARQGGDA